MNKNIIIAVLVAALAGTGYYAYTEHQQVQDLQAQVDDTNSWHSRKVRIISYAMD